MIASMMEAVFSQNAFGTESAVFQHFLCCNIVNIRICFQSDNRKIIQQIIPTKHQRSASQMIASCFWIKNQSQPNQSLPYKIKVNQEAIRQASQETKQES